MNLVDLLHIAAVIRVDMAADNQQIGPVPQVPAFSKEMDQAGEVFDAVETGHSKDYGFAAVGQNTAALAGPVVSED